MKKRITIYSLAIGVLLLSTILPASNFAADPGEFSNTQFDPNVDYQRLLQERPSQMDVYVYWDAETENPDPEKIQRFLTATFLEIKNEIGLKINQKCFKPLYGLKSPELADELAAISGRQHTILPNQKVMIITNMSQAALYPSCDYQSGWFKWVSVQIMGWYSHENNMISINNFDWQTRYVTVGYKIMVVHCLKHEIAHARGLGHSSDKNSLMYPIIDSSFGQWTQEDFANLYAVRSSLDNPMIAFP